MKKILLVFLVIVIAAVLGFIWIIKSGNEEGGAMRTVSRVYLEALRSGDTKKMNTLSTPEFQKKFTEQEYKKLVATSPFLKTHSQAEIQSVSFVEQRVIMGLLDEKNQTHTISYQLSDGENNEKLIALFTVDTPLPSLEPEPKKEETSKNNPKSTIKEIIINDSKVDFFEEYPAASFKPETPAIHIGVLTAREDDLTVTAELIYKETGEKVLRATGTPHGFYYFLGKGTAKGLNFYFTKPTNNWPKGKYSIVIISSKGDTKEAPFEIK